MVGSNREAIDTACNSILLRLKARTPTVKQKVWKGASVSWSWGLCWESCTTGLNLYFPICIDRSKHLLCILQQCRPFGWCGTFASRGSQHSAIDWPRSAPLPSATLQDTLAIQTLSRGTFPGSVCRHWHRRRCRLSTAGPNWWTGRSSRFRQGSKVLAAEHESRHSVHRHPAAPV